MRKWIPGLLVAAAAALSLAVYAELPDAVTLDLSGLLPFTPADASDVLPRPVFAFGLPALALVLWLALHEAPARALGRASARLLHAPDGEYHKFAPTYRLIVIWVVALIVSVHLAGLAAALAWPVTPGTLVGAVFGAGMTVVGNVMPRLRPNAVAGLRTPELLRDPQRWARAHRRYGALWLLGGLAVLVVAFRAPRWGLTAGVAAMLVAMLAMLLASRADRSYQGGLPPLRP